MLPQSWLQPIDIYCERLDPSFWAEPVNALTNIAFLITAYLVCRQDRVRDPLKLILVLLISLIGIGSFLFHTYANLVSAWADILPIYLFMHFYLYTLLRRVFGLDGPGAFAGMLAFAGLNIANNMLVPQMLLNGSIGYLPAVLVLIFCAGWASERGRRQARPLLLAALGFILSLFFRAFDLNICDTLSLGTHFLWHILNAVVLYMLMRALYNTYYSKT